MILRPKEFAEKIKADAIIIEEKKEELKSLVQKAPLIIRQMEANAEMLKYAANELDKFSNYANKPIDFPDYKGSQFYGIDQIRQLSIPSEQSLFYMSASVAAITSDATGSIAPVVTKYPGYESKYLDLLPPSYEQYLRSNELCDLLKELDDNYADTWLNAQNQLNMDGTDSLKNASTNARTVVDQISWLPDYDHLKKYDWFVSDNKGGPTRAVRYAWILHGDKLPAEIGNDCTKDHTWRTLFSGYDKLGKYVHIIKFSKVEKYEVQSSLKAIEIALINYITQGKQRLLERIKARKNNQ